jgi:hypothetical protein
MQLKFLLEKLCVLPPKAMLMLLATAIILIGGYFFTLYAIHGFSPDFLAINQCVESGGRWNYKTRQCEQTFEPKGFVEESLQHSGQ